MQTLDEHDIAGLVRVHRSELQTAVQRLGRRINSDKGLEPDVKFAASGLLQTFLQSNFQASSDALRCPVQADSKSYLQLVLAGFFLRKSLGRIGSDTKHMYCPCLTAEDFRPLVASKVAKAADVVMHSKMATKAEKSVAASLLTQVGPAKTAAKRRVA